MSSKEFKDISNVIKVLDASFDLRVQFIRQIKDAIRANNIPDEDAEYVLLAVAHINDEQILALSNYAASCDFVFPDV